LWQKQKVLRFAPDSSNKSECINIADCFRHSEGPGTLSVWLSALLGGLSMLAKETGITVMLVNLAYDLYRSWHFIKR
jgi:hypothetical protein